MQLCNASAAAVVVMGMSRSGTSLATSMIAALLGNGAETTWRGSSRAYPKDAKNPLGYFERADVVHLNYQLLRTLGTPWTTFQAGFVDRPFALNSSSWQSTRPGGSTFRAAFEGQAEPILADMARHAPFVLKDVRFSRTLPLWGPLLAKRSGARYSGGSSGSGSSGSGSSGSGSSGSGSSGSGSVPRLACVIPFRDPAEVALSSHAASSALGRMRVWQAYLLAALASARAVRCPVLLVDYQRWFTSSATQAAQLNELHGFLSCAGLTSRDRTAIPLLAKLVHPEQRHHISSAQKAAKPADVACLLAALRSGAALNWNLGRGRRTPCAA